MSEKRDEKIEPKTEPKRRVGPFELEGKLGVGGMGVVYLATYTKNGKRMAVKVLAPEMSADQRLVRRFLREMSILSKLRHDHIVRYYGGGKDKTQHFYAMEYMNGGSIEQLLKKKGRLPWEEVIDYSRQIALALEYAHNRGIIHRDLKPANLFLSKGKGLKLGDFGIARDTQATALTAAGRTVGTYAYMAPEQIAGKPPISRKTDIYALGCVMFEMLTGKPPFDAPTAAEMLFAHLEQEPPRVSSTALDCPIWLENIVQKCLEKDPEERFYDALALQVALDEVGPKVAAQQGAAAKTAAGAAGATIKDPSELRGAVSTILGKKKKKKKKNRGPFYQRGWFLSVCLLALIAAVTWAAWPKSAEALWAKAERAREARDLVAAKDVYTQIVNRFPKGDLAEMCRQRIDDIDMELAENEAQTRRRYNRDARSEPQRVYMEVLPYIKLGDCATALQKLRSMVELQKGRDDDPVYVNLARRRIAEIEESGCKRSDLVAFVNEKLQEADSLASKDPVAAHVIWNGIIDLYGSKSELERQVKYARARLGSSGEKLEAPYELVKKRQSEPPSNQTPVKENQPPQEKGLVKGKQ